MSDSICVYAPDQSLAAPPSVVSPHHPPDFPSDNQQQSQTSETQPLETPAPTPESNTPPHPQLFLSSLMGPKDPFLEH